MRGLEERAGHLRDGFFTAVVSTFLLLMIISAAAGIG